MEGKNSLQVTIDLNWGIIHQVWEEASVFLRGYEKNIRDDTLMVISELLENAVKYGEVTLETGQIVFELKREADWLIIKVSNPVKNKGDINQVTAHIDRINTSGDPIGLYLERLSELKKGNAAGKIQLGLYRIAYEGEYSLHYIILNDVVTIIANRKVN